MCVCANSGWARLLVSLCPTTVYFVYRIDLCLWFFSAAPFHFASIRFTSFSFPPSSVSSLEFSFASAAFRRTYVWSLHLCLWCCDTQKKRIYDLCEKCTSIQIWSEDGLKWSLSLDTFECLCVLRRRFYFHAYRIGRCSSEAAANQMNYNTNLIECFIQFFDLTVVELLRTATDMAVIPLFFFPTFFWRLVLTRYDARRQKMVRKLSAFYLTTIFQQDDDNDVDTNHSVQTNIIPFL